MLGWPARNPARKLPSSVWKYKRSTNPAYWGPKGGGGRCTGIRLVARTMAGAHIREAAPPRKMVLRVIRLSWLEIGDVIEPSCHSEGLAPPCYVCRRNGHIPLSVDTTLPQRGRLARAPALLLMRPLCSMGLGDYNRMRAQHIHDPRNLLLLERRRGTGIAWRLCDGDRVDRFGAGEAEWPATDNLAGRTLSLLWLRQRAGRIEGAAFAPHATRQVIALACRPAHREGSCGRQLGISRR